MPTSTYQRHPLTHALKAALFCIGLAGLSPAMAAGGESQRYEIASGSLAETLGRFASASGIALSFDAAQLGNRASPGLQGEFTVDSGFATLLAGSGLQAVRQGNGSYILLASQNSGALELGATSVVGAQLSSTTEGTHSYAAPLVTVGKGVKSVKEIPQAISVVTQQRIQEQNISNVKEALLASPGITAVPSFTGHQFYSRGFFINSFQYDGVPLERQLYARGSSFGGQTAILDRVEVLRGPQGLLEGGGDPSGAVNLVRKRPIAEPLLNITGKAGSWDHYGLQVDAAGSLDEQSRLRGRIVMDYDTTDSFVDYVGSQNQTLYLALDFDLNPDTIIGIGYSRERLDATPYFMGLPNYRNGSMPKFSRSTYLGAKWDNWDRTQDSYYLDIAHQLNDDWKLKGTFIHVREFNDFKYLQRRGNLGPVNTLKGDAYVFDYFSEHWGGDINASGDLDLFGHKLGLTVGANASRLKSHDVWGARYNWVNPLDPFNFQPDDNEPSDEQIYSANTWDDAYNSTQKGVYGVANYALTDDLSVILGARVSDFRTVFTDDGPWGQSRSVAQKNGKVTPYAGLVYKIDPTWNAYASYTEIFKPQTSRTSAGAILDPREGKSYEIGLKGEHNDGRVITSFSLYQMEQKNVAMASDETAGACGGTCYVPSGVIQSRGFEAEVTGEVLDGLQLYAGYTLNLLNYKDEEPATAANITANTDTPKHILRTWANYQLPGDWNKVSIGAGFNSQSSSAGFGYYDREQGGYTIWNGRIAYQIDKNLSAALNINNIFGKKYYSAIDYDHNFYGEPRNMLMTLKYSY